MKRLAGLMLGLVAMVAMGQSITVPGTVTFTPPPGPQGAVGPVGPAGSSPTAAATAAACTASPSCVNAIAVAVAVIIGTPVVTPPPVTPPPPVNTGKCVFNKTVDNQNPVTISNGCINWSGQENFSGAQEQDQVTMPDGSLAICVTGTSTTNNPPGGGGLQPYYQVPDNQTTGNHFSTAPYKFITFVLWPTQAGQSWSSGMLGGSDTPIPGVGLGPSVESFLGHTLVVKAWNTIKIPLGAGGYGLAGQQILKWDLQDNITASIRLNNKYCVKTVTFTVN